MLSFLALFVPYLPVLLQIIGWGLSTFGASEKTLAEYKDMIERASKDGLLSLDSHDRLVAHREKIEARLKEKQQPKP